MNCATFKNVPILLVVVDVDETVTMLTNSRNNNNKRKYIDQFRRKVDTMTKNRRIRRREYENMTFLCV